MTRRQFAKACFLTLAAFMVGKPIKGMFVPLGSSIAVQPDRKKPEAFWLHPKTGDWVRISWDQGG